MVGSVGDDQLPSTPFRRDECHIEWGNWSASRHDPPTVRNTRRSNLRRNATGRSRSDFAAFVAAVTVAATAALVLFGAGTAGAHTDLVSSDPPADAHLEQAPTAVTLTFAGAPMELGATILVVGESDQQWTDGTATVSATAVTVPLRAGAPDGWYQVRWRILSADGALVSGAFDYGVGDLTGKQKVRLAAGKRTASGGDFDIEPQAAQAAHAAQGKGAATTGTDSDGSSPLRLALIGAVGAFAGVGVFATTTTIRSRSGRQPDTDRSQPNTKENQQ